MRIIAVEHSPRTEHVRKISKESIEILRAERYSRKVDEFERSLITHVLHLADMLDVQGIKRLAGDFSPYELTLLAEMDGWHENHYEYFAKHGAKTLRGRKKKEANAPRNGGALVKPEVSGTALNSSDDAVARSQAPDDEIAALKSQQEALVNLVRKVNRGGSLTGLPLPIEGEIASIIGGSGIDADGSPLVTEEGDLVAVNAGDKVFLEVQTNIGFGAQVTRETKLGIAYKIENTDAAPIREAIAQVKAALAGTISEDEAGHGRNERVLNLSRGELDAINDLVDFVTAGTGRTYWYESILNGMRALQVLTDQLTENVKSVKNLTAEMGKLLVAMTAFAAAFVAFMAIL